MRSRSLHIRCSDCLDVDIDIDTVADEHAAGLERLVPFQAEVFPVDSLSRDESDVLTAQQIRGSAAVLDFERHLARRVADEDWAAPSTPVHVVYPSTRHLSPEVKSFVDHLQESMTPVPWEFGP